MQPLWYPAGSNLNLVSLFLLLSLAVYLWAVARRNLFGKQWVLPVGPHGVPLFGNLLQIRRLRRDPMQMAAYVGLIYVARQRCSLTFSQLTSLSQYGEMTTLHMGRRTWVMLNSARVVQEIIAKRASVTSERPYFPIASGLVSRHKRTVLRQTKDWVEGRRVMHYLLNGTAVRNYEKVLDSESIQLLSNILELPNQWYLHHQRYAYSVVHRIVVGERPQQTQEQLDDFQRVTREFVRSINASVIDFFTELSRLPRILQPWRRHWEAMGLDHHEVFKAWWAPIRHNVSKKTAQPTFIKDILLHTSTKFSKDDEEAMYLASSIVAAGSDNVRMTLNVLIMSALCYPDTVQKARKEITSVCGDSAERLPGLADMKSLPYVSAIIKEGLRWRPTVPLIPQHHLTQDLEFEGYRFPTGTDFVINALALCNDCEDATIFKPERWLDGKEDIITQGLWQFGGGRRICVGHKVAQQELFLAYSRMIYCFDFTAVRLSASQACGS